MLASNIKPIDKGDMIHAEDFKQQWNTHAATFKPGDSSPQDSVIQSIKVMCVLAVNSSNLASALINVTETATHINLFQHAPLSTCSR